MHWTNVQCTFNKHFWWSDAALDCWSVCNKVNWTWQFAKGQDWFASSQWFSVAIKWEAISSPRSTPQATPKSRTPLILLELEDNSELPDSVRFPETRDYFKQLHVRRSTNTGFAFICLNPSQHKACGELGKKRPHWQLEEHSGPNFPSPSSLQNPSESSHLLPHPQGTHYDPVPTNSWLIAPTPEAKGVLLGDNFGCLEFYFFYLPKLT